MNMLDSGPTHPVDSVALHHLLCEVNAVSGTGADSVTLALSLYVKLADGSLKQLSEAYALDIPSAESFSTLARSSRLKTLFTELSAADIGEGAGADSKLYFVVKVLGGEAPRTNTPPKSRSSSSRDGTVVSKGPSSVT